MSRAATSGRLVSEGILPWLGLAFILLIADQFTKVLILGQYKLGDSTYVTSFFISRTACSKPTMMARATMVWPMFSSDMPEIAAMGFTLR